MNNELTLTVDEVAQLLHADTETVMQYARRGELPGTRIGKPWIFMRDDVVAFLRNQIAADTEARVRARANSAVIGVSQVTPRSRRRAPPLLPNLPVRNSSDGKG